MMEIGAVMTGLFQEVFEHLKSTGVENVGQAFGRYAIDEAQQSIDIEAGFTTSGPIHPSGRPLRRDRGCLCGRRRMDRQARSPAGGSSVVGIPFAA